MASSCRRPCARVHDHACVRALARVWVRMHAIGTLCGGARLRSKLAQQPSMQLHAATPVETSPRRNIASRHPPGLYLLSSCIVNQPRAVGKREHFAEKRDGLLSDGLRVSDVAEQHLWEKRRLHARLVVCNALSCFMCLAWRAQSRSFASQHSMAVIM